MPETAAGRRVRSGNQMVVEGALRAGCRFFSGYPITPASEIYREMTARLQAQGDVAIGAPDEISALCYCIGASHRGIKAMTATSGPGFALMVEALQYAVMTETPVVVARLSPKEAALGGVVAWLARTGALERAALLRAAAALPGDTPAPGRVIEAAWALASDAT
jgi:hypothetical protein